MWTPRCLPVAALTAVAAVFGSTYIVMKGAVAGSEPTAFLTTRFAIGTLVLWPVARLRARSAGEVGAGVVGGLALAVGYVLQTIGLERTTSAGSALALSVMVIIIPVAHATLGGRLPGGRTLAVAAVAVVGVRLMADGSLGDRAGLALSLGAAFAFAAHLLISAATAQRHDPLRLATIQLTVVAVGCGALSLASGSGGFVISADALPAALFTGVVVSAGALSLQLWAQRYVPAVVAAVVLCLEPVVAVVIGHQAGEPIAGSAGVGAVLVLVAVAIAALDQGSKATRRPAQGHRRSPLGRSVSPQPSLPDLAIPQP